MLRVNKDEHFTMSVNSFYCYNDFINIIVILIVIINIRYNLNVESLNQTYYLNTGNPKIFDIISDIIINCQYI